VASSQAYRQRFATVSVDLLGSKKEEALQWLTRDLDEAILRFIKSAQDGDILPGCFYEFRYEPVAKELKAAIDSGGCSAHY